MVISSRPARVFMVTLLVIITVKSCIKSAHRRVVYSGATSNLFTNVAVPLLISISIAITERRRGIFYPFVEYQSFFVTSLFYR